MESVPLYVGSRFSGVAFSMDVTEAPASSEMQQKRGAIVENSDSNEEENSDSNEEENS